MEDVFAVAKYQKRIVQCILTYFGLVLIQFFVPVDIRALVIGSLATLVILCGAYFTFNLCRKAYVGWTGILMAVLSLIPFVGFIILLIANAKASSILKANGFKVGFFGADLDEVKN